MVIIQRFESLATLCGNSLNIESSEKPALCRYRAVQNDRGFTLFEIIVSVLILAIAIVPMVNAFNPAILSFYSISDEEETAVFSNQARGTLNRIAALDFDTLSTNQGDPVNLVSLFGSSNEADKETFIFKGQSYTPAVAITDASGGAGGLLELTVTVGHVSFKTLKADI